MGLTEIWNQCHELNQRYLPEGKKIRIAGLKSKDEDPYQEISKRDEISGRFQFTFRANVLNTSKGMLQQALGTLLQTYVSSLALQLGITDAEHIYRLLRDFGEALGPDPDDYLKPPTPDANRPRIFMEEAISTIMLSAAPDGVPAEPGGAQEHLFKLIEFSQSDQFGLLTPVQVDIFQTYLTEVQERAVQEARQQQLLQAAQEFGQAAQGGGQPGRPAQSPPAAPQGSPQISGPGELTDETLPGAGGGAVQE